MKRAVVPPIFTVEVEPGEAIKIALKVRHPFAIPAALPPGIDDAIGMLCRDQSLTVRFRSDEIAFWEDRAVQLLDESLRELDNVPDQSIRELYCKGRRLGEFLHIRLWAEMLAAAQCPDTQLLDEMIHGMKVVGPVAASKRWPPLPPVEPALSLAGLKSRAWELRSKILGK